MEETDNKRIIDKIRSTLNLANAKDDHESHTAMLLAQQMMAKYGIAMEDVEVGDSQSQPPPKELMEMFATKAMKLTWWQKNLSGVIADNFRCFTYYRTISGKSRIIFLGVKEDTQVAREVFLYAQDSIEYLSVRYLDSRGVEGLSERTRVRNDYITGFIKGLKDKFKEQVEENEWGLILVKDDALIERHSSMKFTSAQSSSVGRAFDSEAIAAGHSDGQRMNHNNKVLK